MHILVLGVGNILLTDEAIGVRIVEALEQRYILPDYVADPRYGGTAGRPGYLAAANRDHLICGCHCLRKNARGTMMILRDEEDSGVVYQQKSLRISLARPTYCQPCAPGEFPKKADRGRRDPESLEPHIGLTPDGRSDELNLLLSSGFWQHTRIMGVKPIPREATRQLKIAVSRLRRLARRV